MELGTFSVSLTVKDIRKSVEFYSWLGFQPLEECGSLDDKWLILQKGTTIIGVFEGMFEKNILTFNPADARSIETHLKSKGVSFSAETQGESGPTHFVMNDPDGNVIMFDQHTA